MKKIIFLIILSLLIGCKGRKSENILDRKTYKNVLKEIIFANLIQQDLRHNDSLNKNLLSLIYHKYHIDSMSIKKTTDYYSKHPEQLSQIYDQIYKALKKTSDSLEKRNPKKKPKTDKIILPKKNFKKKNSKVQ